jgi:ribosome assembly protein 4
VKSGVEPYSPAHTNSVTSIKWGGEGLLYSASRDTTILVWDAKDGKVVRQLKVGGCTTAESS